MRLCAMFDPDVTNGAAVGTRPGERGALEDFTGMFFEMNSQHQRGDQLPMCEVWVWLTQSLPGTPHLPPKAKQQG